LDRPPAFREDRLETLHALIVAYPLATLVTAGVDGLNANLIPFTIATDRGEKGTLRAHLAKANDEIKTLRESTQILVFSSAACVSNNVRCYSNGSQILWRGEILRCARSRLTF